MSCPMCLCPFGSGRRCGEILQGPNGTHACMVNLYGRAGRIDEAYELTKTKMGGFEAVPSVWGALLYSCYLHSNANIGEIAAKALFELEPDNYHSFQILSRRRKSTNGNREFIGKTSSEFRLRIFSSCFVYFDAISLIK
ncbi:hypothetical protein M9H77_10573 [Catharanthus roseus]|uniref:Uncharacterized protein n=1 Tax=Catharanthus roseus TaxID=4058 RepID=A0ACC0BC60_CATRO|nr:hypothetical protein M9H77_10573 [Catharanthus roseus]